DSEKWTAYELIIKMKDCKSYLHKTHSNYCTHIEHKRRMRLKGESLTSSIVAFIQKPSTHLLTSDKRCRSIALGSLQSIAC
ncbi:hypothetical protein BD311DRAFT_679341, partial [Dichomitus squalens]